MSSVGEPFSRLLSPRDTATALGVSLSTLAKWRCLRSDGPRFVRLGRAVRYPPDDVADFINRNKHNSTSDYVA
jgi:predicted DNA-binding transcriptional regulator AlpA